MSIRRKMAKGAAWMISLRMVDRLIGLISTIILARLLLPEDFGLVAMSMAVYGLLELLGAFGLDVVLIQHEKPQRVHYDTAWTLSVTVLGAQALLLYLCAPAAAVFYGNPEVEPVLRWLALGFLFDGLRNIGVVNFRRNLDFNREFAFLFTRRIIGFVVTVYLAYELRSHWALVYGILASRLSGLVLSYLMEPFRPRLTLGALGEIYHFSKHLLLNNFLHFLLDRAPDFVLGRIAGSAAVGIYRVAYDVAALPVTELSAPVNRAIMPGFSRQQRDLAALANSFLEVFGTMALIAIPAGMGLVMVANPLVYVLLGENWKDVVPVISVVALWGVGAGVAGCAGPLYLALGVPHILTRLALMRLMVLLPSLYIGAHHAGALGAAYALLVTLIVILPVNLYYVCSYLKISLLEIMGRAWRPGLSASVMSGFLYLSVGEYTGYSDVVRLVGLVLFGGSCYVSCLFVLWLLCGRPESIERRLYYAIGSLFK